jgi:hypothetical protein
MVIKKTRRFRAFLTRTEGLSIFFKPCMVLDRYCFNEVISAGTGSAISVPSHAATRCEGQAKGHDCRHIKSK